MSVYAYCVGFIHNSIIIIIFEFVIRVDCVALGFYAARKHNKNIYLAFISISFSL